MPCALGRLLLSSDSDNQAEPKSRSVPNTSARQTIAATDGRVVNDRGTATGFVSLDGITFRPSQ